MRHDIRLVTKLTGEAERATQTTLDTIEINKKMAASWKSPPFQRELRMVPKVVTLGEEIRVTGVIPGVLTLGVLDEEVYVVDGQHRLGAFLATDLISVYADVRTHHFRTMGAMANEYVLLNSQLVRLRPDDILKGLEQSNVHLREIRTKCPFVGYDSIRRNGKNSPVLSMSTVLRVWWASAREVPSFGGTGAVMVAGLLDNEETAKLLQFLNICFNAWRRDSEYRTLWGSLNLILCAWLYRRVLVDAPGNSLSRSTRLTLEQFRASLQALSAESEYMEYLVGRRVSDHDRAPAYNRIKGIFARRYMADTKQRLLLPGPTWAHGGG
jgi:hypothetical protein